jgi:branched-subunit amino acid aminotransferase/4-amino-4-deoxychorismate lyase
MVRLLNLVNLAFLGLLLVADSVPTFDVEAHCRRLAQDARPVGDPRACLQEEAEARAQLVAQWAQFPAADRSFCRDLTTLGGEPTFTELLTCLEMRREAKRLRDNENATTAAPATDAGGSPRAAQPPR